MTLLGDRLLVKLAPPKAETASGLITSAEYLPKPPCMGKVVLAGPACCDVKPGDMVIWAPEATVEPLGEMLPVPHVILLERSIEAVIERTV